MSAATLPDAILQALRDSPVALTTSDTFDPDTQTGAIDIGFDYLPPQTTQPYVVIKQPGEFRSYFTRGGDGSRPFLAEGGLAVECYSGSRDGAEALAGQVATTLHDNPLQWGLPLNRMMHLRCVSSQFVPIADTGLSSPTLFLCVLALEFTYQGVI